MIVKRHLFKYLLLLFVIILGFVIILWVISGRWIDAGQKPIADGENDYAIILGAKVNGEIPSLALRYRLDAALDYAKKYPHVKFILSGGQGPGEEINEAEAMKRFLNSNGIKDERLLLETKSTSTYENLLFSKNQLPVSTKSVTIITSDFHLARAKILASKLDLQIDVVSAKTPKIVEAKLRTRERLALFKTYLMGK